jgi:HK97 family phage portal protein
MSLFDLFKKPQVEQKAYNVEANPLQLLLNGGNESKNYSPSELLKFNNGWIYTCNNKTSQTIASVPIKLYYTNSNSKELKWTKHKKIDKKTFNYIIEHKDINMDVVEVLDHEVLNILNAPNDRMNYFDLTYITESYLGLIGNCYWYINENSIYPLKSENVSVIIEDSDIGYGKIQSYKYEYSPSKYRFFKPEEIIHFCNYVPGNTLYGKGELESAISYAERETYYNIAENYINKNLARPDFVVSYKNGIKENELRETNKQWYKRFGSAKNQGKPIIVGGDIDIKNINLPPKEMSWEQGRKDVQKNICSIFGVPEALVELNQANYASASAATEHYMIYTIKPKLIKYLEKINTQLVKKYDGELFLWPEAGFEFSSDALKTAQIDQIYSQLGVYGNEYIRDKLGIPQNAAEGEEEGEEDENTNNTNGE